MLKSIHCMVAVDSLCVTSGTFLTTSTQPTGMLQPFELAARVRDSRRLCSLDGPGAGTMQVSAQVHPSSVSNATATGYIFSESQDRLFRLERTRIIGRIMPSLGDSAVIIFLGLLLFGPKGLAQIARQLGKLMGEFRRASNEFRMQMEEELRISEQADRQKEIAAIEAAAPAPPVLVSSVEDCPEDHPHLRAASADAPLDPLFEPIGEVGPVPIATSGDLSIMPPATGLPSPRSSSIASFVESVPHVDAPDGHLKSTPAEEPHPNDAEQKPMRYTNHHEENEVTPDLDAIEPATESVHG